MLGAAQELNKALGISNDVYNRTTSEKHKQCCRLLFERSLAAGEIYLDSYEGWYNVREETFVTESDAATSNFLDPVSGKELVKMKEESYFFRQSRSASPLLNCAELLP